MKNIEPKTPLTSAILSSLITKTTYCLETIYNGELPESYAGHRFLWQKKPEFDDPNLIIIGDFDTVKIWTNDKLENEMNITSNIDFDAENNLPKFIAIEAVLVEELTNLYKDWENAQAFEYTLHTASEDNHD